MNSNEETNEAELRLNLDLLTKKRERVEIYQAAYKRQVAKYFNRRVKHRSFQPNNLVLREVTLDTKELHTEKSMWESPYKVTKVSRLGTCWSEDMGGKAFPHTWNAEHLKYYQ